MRHLIVLAAVAAAVSMASAPSSASYVGNCTGQVDTNCRAWICQGNCFQRDCAIWVNVVPGTPLCLSPVT